MSTDIYGVRVLDVDPDKLRISFRVFVVYYDTAGQTHAPVPDDPSFFFYMLWTKGRLRELIDVDTALDGQWVDANTRRYVSRVERIAGRNHPPTPEQWERLYDFYYERHGGWKDEDLLVQWDYDVYVTERRWIEGIEAGEAWGTTFFPCNADTWTDDDAPHIPDLAGPVVTINPFDSASGDTAYDHLSGLEFSDDGRYLALVSNARIWVYDTADWSEVAHVSLGDGWLVPLLMWVPGEHVVTVKSYRSKPDEDDGAQWAFDVDARTEVDAPFQPGRIRSRTGGYWIGNYNNEDGGYDIHAPGRPPRPTSVAGGEWDPIQRGSFAADGSRLFLGSQENLYVVDPATGEVVDKVVNASQRLFALASNPDGSYLAVGSFSRKLPYLLLGGDQRPHELCVWRTSDMKIIMGGQLTTYVEALAWSPDGRWLAAILDPVDADSSVKGQSQLAIYRMDPRRDH
ncbi:hypothetical protein ABZ801_03850 [Actinomadura sp. NPDC047616]|uniref:WD40 repeat domain-containing protein n=1 Tax=Actinomadura sp. NPDC047616 TaxID=3155914 RepID=UPI0033D65173